MSFRMHCALQLTRPVPDCRRVMWGPWHRERGGPAEVVEWTGTTGYPYRRWARGGGGVQHGFGPLRNPWEWKASMRGGTEMEGHAEVLKLLTGYVQQVPRHFRWRPRVSDGPKGECGGPVLAVGTRTPHGSQHPTLGVRFLNLPQPSLPLLQYNLRKRETPQAVAFPSLRINLLIYADAKAWTLHRFPFVFAFLLCCFFRDEQPHHHHQNHTRRDTTSTGCEDDTRSTPAYK